MNLDPFNEYSDGDLWLSLERAHLKQLFAAKEEKLQYEITDGGGNLRSLHP